MPDPPPRLFVQAATEAGRDPEVSERAAAVAGRIRARGATPVFTLGHLAYLTGARARYLREVASRRRDPYVDIKRPKRNGSTRPISSPEPVLMDVQRWILQNVLVAYEHHPSSWAYRPKRSIVGCAELHIGARWLVKLDIHNFFGSVTEATAFEVFAGLDYPRLLSFELARLCTRSTGIERGYRDGRQPYLRHTQGVLPQGAPTSGALANAAMTGVDARLAELAETRGLIYTRYSDDLVFSAGNNFSRADAAQLVRDASLTLQRAGFRIHQRKTRIVPPGARKVVLGLLVLDDRIALQSAFKRQLEVHVRGVRTFGLLEHARHRHFRSVLSMVEHIDGSIAFARGVDRAFGEAMKVEWASVLREVEFPA